MATGITYGVHGGNLSLGHFVWSAARSMGALIFMKDDSSDAKISFKRAEQFFDDSIKNAEGAFLEAQREKDEFEAWTVNELKAKYEKEKVLAEKSRRSRKDNDEIVRGNYQTMLEKLENIPPEFPVEFRKFMFDQLTDSLKHDCGPAYFSAPQTFEEWLASTRDSQAFMLESRKERLDRMKKQKKEVMGWLYEVDKIVPRPVELNGDL
jgi:hypothetical protein